MNSNHNKVKYGGIGIISGLTLVFVILKIFNIIDWPWIVVLSPIWISSLLALAVFIVILVAGRIKKGKW